MKMNKKVVTLLTCALVGASAIGVTAAGTAFDNRSHGVLKYNYDGTESEVAINADDIGYYITAENLEGAGKITAPTQGTKYVISKDSGIEADSIIEVYYKEDCKNTVAAATAQYSQKDNEVAVTFKNKPNGDVTIEWIKVTNPGTN